MRTHVAAIAAVVALLSCSTSARAQSRSQPTAAGLSKAGQKLMARKKYGEACEKFAASYERDPALGMLLNLAICHDRLGKSATAWNEYSEVQAKAARANQRNKVAYATARIKALTPKLIRFTLFAPTPAPEGLKVSIDGLEIPPAALGTSLSLDPGAHQLLVSAPGRRSWTRTFAALTGAKPQRIDIPQLEVIAAPPAPPAPALVAVESAPDSPPAALVPAPPSAAPVAPESPATQATETVKVLEAVSDPAPAVRFTPAASSSVSGSVERATPAARLVGFSALGIGAAGLVAGGVLGFRAMSLAGDRDELCAPGSVCLKQEAFDLDHSARTAQQWGIVSAVAGAAVVGIGAALVVSSGGDAPPVQVVPSADKSGAAVSLIGLW